MNTHASGFFTRCGAIFPWFQPASGPSASLRPGAEHRHRIEPLEARIAPAVFSNATSIVGPDSGSAAPFPSEIAVTGLSGVITDVNVTLSGITHGNVGDVDVLLVSPTGKTFIFASDVLGSSSVSNLTVTFDDSAASAAPDATLPVPPGFSTSSTPVNYVHEPDVFGAPAPAGPYASAAPTGAATFASVFNGLHANGVWQLFVVDDTAGNSGTIAGGWSIDITTAPQPNIELSSLNGANGFTINGVAANNYAGYSVSDAGDVNGDGFDDVIIGAQNVGPDYAGASYVVFGKAGGFAASLELSALNGSNGFKLSGVAASDIAGRSVSAAGDVNGDGFDDVIIGAPQAGPHGPNSGASYVVFGKADFSGLTNGNLDLSTLDGTNGFKLSGVAADDRSGRSVSAAGDVNGDGFDDLLIGALRADPHGSNSGASYVVFGQADFSSTMGNLDLSTLDGTNGFKLSGVVASDFSGQSVSAAGDVNGDGFDDLIIGAQRASPHGSNEGASYVVFGKATGFAANLDLSTLNGTNGFKLSGVANGDFSGGSVSAAGDVNGDGFDDLLIGAYGADANGADSGASYVVFGKATGFAANLELSTLNGTNGFKLSGVADDDKSGRSVSAAGDVNGDGFDDLIIGAPEADPHGDTEGASYVVFGKADFSGTAGNLKLSTLDGSNGFKLSGVAAGDESGYSVSAAGDVNGDGFDDLLIGAYDASPHGSRSGASYVLFGFDTGAVTHLGGSGAQTLTGNSSANVFVAGTGGDTMIGNGGADVFHGGEGADVIAISDLTFKRIDGGNGFDTLRLDTSGATLDLTAIADNKITGIEQIDITGLSPNTLKLDQLEVLNLSGESNTLIVRGDADDRVQIEPGWTRGADVMIGPDTFKVFTQGAATLKVAAAVLVNANIDLSGLDGANGFTINGVAANDDAGRSVSDAGDVNGDGFDDVIIGAYRADPHGDDSGAGYVVFGKAGGFAANLDLSTLDGANGFKLSGVAASDYSGCSVSAAGDVNGDGFDDLIVGARGADPHGSYSGASYVVFGKADFSALPGGNLDLSTLDGANGFKLSGVAEYDYSGFSVSAAGDVNGDGFDDLIVGARGADPHGDYSGASYVVFGKADFSGLPAGNLDLSTLDGTNGFKLSGVAASDQSGRSVSAAGDVNGDGFDDLIVGAPYADPHGSASGASYVVFGKADFSGTAGNLDLSTLDGANGFKLSGVAADDRSGFSVSGAGDVNGDGFDDLIIGARSAAPHGTDSGASYVVFGKAGGFAANLELSALDGANGFKLSGVAAGDQSGRSVSAAGDVNGDGFDDLIIGALGADPNGINLSGASYVVFGKADFSGTAGNLDLSTLDGANGFQLSGVAVFDRSGCSVSAAGDVNGDGFDDLIVGAYGADPHGTDSGASYVLFGFDTGAVTHHGNGTANTLTGTVGANVMNGAQAADTLIGNGGADVQRGGEGDDVLAISDAGFFGLRGGRGHDTLRLDGPGFALDLTTLRDNKLTGIEEIDLRGAGNHTLTLNLHEVLALSDTSNSLVVHRTAGDDVNIGPGWTHTGVETILGERFDVFTQGAATLKVTAANLDLSSLDGANGFTINGVAASDFSGYSVSDAGDVNGDGFDDVIIGAFGANPHGSDSGASYVVFGKEDGFGAGLDLSTLNGTNGFKLSGVAVLDNAGFSVSAAGDVNGDGFDDLIIGAPYASPHGTNSGASYVVFGKADFSGLPAGNLDLSTLSGTNGFKLSGVAEYDYSGYSVSAAGDVNGDGFDDLIIGAKGADPHGSDSGASYVVFGKADFSGTMGNLDLSTLDGTNGFKLSGVMDSDNSGRSVSAAGDVNGDGFADLIIGAYGADPHGTDSGASYVVFGKADFSGTAGNLDLSTINGTNGFKLSGVAGGDDSGLSVSAAGDVNGDGFADLIIGALGADPNGSKSGASYVVFGKADFSSTANLDLSTLNGSNGFKLSGVATNDNSGRSVSAAGDVNGDGFDDLIVGAKNASPHGDFSGASYVVFGKADFSGTTGNLDLSTLDGANGFKLSGVAFNNQSGSSVSAAGDVNGDGFDDLIIGAPSADPHGSRSGASYVVFGFDTGAVTHLGGSGAQTLTGDAGANVFVAGTGGDTMIGNGGADVFHGGEGADVIAISDLTFKRIVGGNGFDTLRLDTSGATLDLTAIADNKITGIEQIDITGLSPNTLKLDKREVLNLSGESNTLIVRGDADDSVQIELGWKRGPDEMIGPDSFKVFTQGAATLKVAADVAVAANFDLSSLDGSNGLKLSGVTAFDNSGFSVSDAGDVNGDGFDDLIIGTPNADPHGTDSGASYVVFGKATGFAANLDLSTLDGANGFKLSGVAGSDKSGFSVSAAGDVNGDGFDDLIVGALSASPHGSYSGASYVVFGKADFSGLPAGNLDLSTLNGTNGFKLSGVAGDDQSGVSVSAAGDVNGDGFADLIIGAYRASPHGSSSGASYVVFGKADFSGLPAGNLDLSTLDGSNGFKLSGVAAGDYSGGSVSAAGDVNGDGFADLIIGAYHASPHGNRSGASYVVFGKADFSGLPAGNLDLSTLDGSNGFKLSGVAASDRSGFSVSAAGDVNGDGFDDLLIGAAYADAHGSNSGASYVVFGKADFSGLPAGNLDLSTLNGTNGFKLSGVAADDYSGRSVSTAGDLNGDGFDDLIIGANFADPHGSYSGASYVVFGKADFSGTAGNLDLSTLDGTNGFKLSGVAGGDYSGRSVSTAGDVNGDGFDDLIIGAYGADPHGSFSGASYVVFGFDTGAVTHQGNGTANTLTGTAGADVMIGGQDDDTLIGNGGADVQRGGEGDDVLAVSDAGFLNVRGGNGDDTLQLDGSGFALDLTALRDNKLTGLEQIDLSGAGDHTLTLNQHEVLALSNSSNTLVVTRDAGDTVNIGPGWTQGASEEIDGDLFDVFTQGAATLKVQSVETVVEITPKTAHSVKFVDVDGDLVTVTVSKGKLAASDLRFVESGVGAQLQLIDFSDDGTEFQGAAITVSAVKKPGGDGLVNVGRIDAHGIDLGTIRVSGDLGQIDAGNTNLATTGLANLAVGSLGVHADTQRAGTADPLHSEIVGNLGSIVTKKNVAGVLDVTGGAKGTIGRAIVGGDLDGSAGGAEAGLIRSSGNIGPAKIKGSVIGGANFSGILAGGELGQVTIAHDLKSADPAKPVILSALGKLGATKAADAVAIAGISVKTNVLNARILAGYTPAMVPLNPDAGIGAIKVDGKWEASSVAAGVQDTSIAGDRTSLPDGFGQHDTLIAGDTTATLFATIASITIKGTAIGSVTPTTDFFGITAQKIGKVKINGATIAPTGADTSLDAANNDFHLVRL